MGVFKPQIAMDEYGRTAYVDRALMHPRVTSDMADALMVAVGDLVCSVERFSLVLRMVTSPELIRHWLARRLDPRDPSFAHHLQYHLPATSPLDLLLSQFLRHYTEDVYKLKRVWLILLLELYPEARIKWTMLTCDAMFDGNNNNNKNNEGSQRVAGELLKQMYCLYPNTGLPEGVFSWQAQQPPSAPAKLFYAKTNHVHSPKRHVSWLPDVLQPLICHTWLKHASTTGSYEHLGGLLRLVTNLDCMHDIAEKIPDAAFARELSVDMLRLVATRTLPHRLIMCIPIDVWLQVFDTYVIGKYTHSVASFPPKLRAQIRCHIQIKNA
jgi:hypothetical protein